MYKKIMIQGITGFILILCGSALFDLSTSQETRNLSVEKLGAYGAVFMYTGLALGFAFSARTFFLSLDKE